MSRAGRGCALAALALLFASAPGCGKAAPCKPGDWNVESGFPNTLDQVCMVSLANDQVALKPGVTPYTLNTPLFSDGAVKVRTIWMPPGQSAQYDPVNTFQFPNGTVITKSFGFRSDLREANPSVRWIETRVLAKRQAGWVGVSYAWNDAGTEASVNYAGGVVPVEWIDDGGVSQSTGYLVPNGNQCEQCHNLSGEITPIGPKARNINCEESYPDGGVINQLAEWSDAGLLSGAPDPSSAPRLPVWNDPTTGTVEARARAYLEMNCAHCHNPQGSAGSTGFYLWADETDPAHDGICKPPVAAGEATGGFSYDIVPGDPAHSILVYRIESVLPGIMMPQIGRSIVDSDGVALVTQWIAGLDGGCAE